MKLGQVKKITGKVIRHVAPNSAPVQRGEYRKLIDASTGEILAESSTGRSLKERFDPNVEIGDAFTKHMDKKIIDEHTHPDMSQASAEDLALLGWSHVDKVRVKAIDGTLYEYSRPAGVQLTPRKIKDLWNKYDTQLNNEGKLLEMSVEDYIAEVNKKVLNETGIKFKSINPQSKIKPTKDTTLKGATAIAAGSTLLPKDALAKKHKQMESDQALQDAYSPVDMVIAGATGGATMGLRAISALADPVINYAIDRMLGD
jgi:hypothetical protein